MAQEKLVDVLVRLGLAENIKEARALVMAGEVYQNELRLDRPALNIKNDSGIHLRNRHLRYVSRGGLKLEGALKAFPISLAGRVCMDVGSSTGGFTDCCLQNDAALVYAVDVGYGLLDYRLREDKRVVLLERTNARALQTEMFAQIPSFASMDLSFISVKTVLPAVVPCLTSDAELVILVKPQFEAARDQVEKGGLVTDPEVHRQVLEEVLSFLPKVHLVCKGLAVSPIHGTDGNTEFLLYAKKEDSMHNGEADYSLYIYNVLNPMP
ncbi:MAG: TlyA family RNA methyltransferase [Clostridia bacterium]|nr:TlyA family RNA methyltransferase [Clostridia bacterium]